ncbi:DUF1049 domain-containing protein [Sporolactobacillus sp. THM7-4]|nr:DUF1049 domain-containing protein [Sporolactobacillus sp. THM7-4]
MNKQWGILLGLIFTLLIVLFSIANVDNVTFSFLLGQVRLPLILVIIGSVLLGALLISSFAFKRIHQQNREIRNLQRQLHRFEVTGARQPDRSAGETVTEEKETRSSRHHSLLKR